MHLKTCHVFYLFYTILRFDHFTIYTKLFWTNSKSYSYEYKFYVSFLRQVFIEPSFTNIFSII